MLPFVPCCIKPSSCQFGTQMYPKRCSCIGGVFDQSIDVPQAAGLSPRMEGLVDTPYIFPQFFIEPTLTSLLMNDPRSDTFSIQKLAHAQLQCLVLSMGRNGFAEMQEPII